MPARWPRQNTPWTLTRLCCSDPHHGGQPLLLRCPVQSGTFLQCLVSQLAPAAVWRASRTRIIATAVFAEDFEIDAGHQLLLSAIRTHPLRHRCPSGDQRPMSLQLAAVPAPAGTFALVGATRRCSTLARAPACWPPPWLPARGAMTAFDSPPPCCRCCRPKTCPICAYGRWAMP